MTANELQEVERLQKNLIKSISDLRNRVVDNMELFGNHQKEKEKEQVARLLLSLRLLIMFSCVSEQSQVSGPAGHARVSQA